MMLASCQSSAGDTEAALEAFRSGLEEYPDDYGLNFNISITLVNQGKYEQAIQHLETAVRADPWSASPFFVIGGAYVQLGRIEEGLLAYLAFLRREVDTERSSRGAGAALDLAYSRVPLNESGDKPQIVITVGPDESRPELDMLSTTLGIAAAATMTEGEIAVPEFESLSRVLRIFITAAADLDLESDTESFFARHLVGNAAAIKSADVAEAFSYLVVTVAGVEGAGEWLRNNTEATDALVDFLSGEIAGAE
jgi:tetratricopeptide (TPR) repeat protein